MQYILIADDNMDITDVLEAYVRKEGYEPLVAADGEEALRLFRQHEPAAVLLDVMMPKEDGYEVCRKIRAVSDTPVILITARGEDFERVMGLDIGIKDSCAKSSSLILPSTSPMILSLYFTKEETLSRIICSGLISFKSSVL